MIVYVSISGMHGVDFGMVDTGPWAMDTDISITSSPGEWAKLSKTERVISRQTVGGIVFPQVAGIPEVS